MKKKFKISIICSANEIIYKYLYYINIFSGMAGCSDVGIMNASNFFQGSVVFYFTRSDIMSLAVSDPAQKKGVPCSF